MHLRDSAMTVLAIVVVALVVGLSPGLMLIVIALAVLLLDAHDARILDAVTRW